MNKEKVVDFQKYKRQKYINEQRNIQQSEKYEKEFKDLLNKPAVILAPELGTVFRLVKVNDIIVLVIVEPSGEIRYFNLYLPGDEKICKIALTTAEQHEQDVYQSSLLDTSKIYNHMIECGLAVFDAMSRKEEDGELIPGMKEITIPVTVKLFNDHSDD